MPTTITSVFGESPVPATVDELRAYVATRGDPPRTANKIAGLRRLWHDDKSENFYLEGCVAAAVKAAGGAPEYDYMFFITVGGTVFTQHYGRGCDGLASLLGHRAVPYLLKQCGYSYLYVDRATIETQPELTFDIIKTAIDKGIPVMSWGIANLPLRNVAAEHPHGCWCNIGGYDENGVLYVNAYPENEITDEHGYFTVKDGLSGSDGLYILLGKIPAPTIQEAYRDALSNIPAFITIAPFNDATFGKQAYHDWADSILNDEYAADDWDKYNGPWITQQTCFYFMRTYFDRLIRESGLSEAEEIKATYMRIHELSSEIQRLHGGEFFPDRELFAKPEIRAALADVLRQMSDLHDGLQ